MKGIYIFITLLLVTATFGFGQNSSNLVLSNFAAELNGNNIEIDTTITVTLIPDLPKDILIYETDFISYRAVFTYKYKGKRVKLISQTYAVLPDGKMVKSKQKKDMQELKVSVTGKLKGKSSESILYARKTMGNIFVSFNYELIYR